ncbi:MAG: GtrA family protein [Chloroflexota bacterium]
MSQVSSTQEKPNDFAGIRLPIDGLIEWVAHFIANILGSDKEREFVRFFKFACVGILGAIIDLGVSNILFVTVLPPTDAAGDTLLTNIVIAATISFSFAITSNFIWNRYWTYPDSRSRPLGEQLFLFAFICTIGWLGRSAWLSFSSGPITDFMVANAPIDPQLAGQLGANIAILLAIFIVMIWNFVVNRYWTFNDVE